MRFCPQCGRKVAGMNRSFLLTIGFAALGLFAVVYGMQRYLQPPQQLAMTERHFEGAPVANPHDPELDALRVEIEQDPKSMEKLKILAGAIGDKLRNNPEAPPALVFEAIDILGKILTIEPNDPGALVMMADVSFDQRAFTKAREFYERYLKIEPDNLGARARYASTLTFLGEYDKSIDELNSVLKIDPKNFPAMAYLAITYAQRGDLPKAKQFGASALNIAPSEEAKARFSAFMTTLNEGDAGQGARGGVAKVSDVGTSQTGLMGFISSVRANPVAGPKFVRYDDSKAGIVRLFFRDFPMGQMPPFAKEKFFTTLRQAAASAKLESVGAVTFVDDATGGEMATISLK